jgi:hypothetical protein
VPPDSIRGPPRMRRDHETTFPGPPSARSGEPTVSGGPPIVQRGPKSAHGGPMFARPGTETLARGPPTTLRGSPSVLPGPPSVLAGPPTTRCVARGDFGGPPGILGGTPIVLTGPPPKQKLTPNGRRWRSSLVLHAVARVADARVAHACPIVAAVKGRAAIALGNARTAGRCATARGRCTGTDVRVPDVRAGPSVRAVAGRAVRVDPADLPRGTQFAGSVGARHSTAVIGGSTRRARGLAATCSGRAAPRATLFVLGARRAAELAETCRKAAVDSQTGSGATVVGLGLARVAIMAARTRARRASSAATFVRGRAWSSLRAASALQSGPALRCNSNRVETARIRKGLRVLRCTRIAWDVHEDRSGATPQYEERGKGRSAKEDQGGLSSYVHKA